MGAVAPRSPPCGAGRSPPRAGVGALRRWKVASLARIRTCRGVRVASPTRQRGDPSPTGGFPRQRADPAVTEGAAPGRGCPLCIGEDRSTPIEDHDPARAHVAILARIGTSRRGGGGLLCQEEHLSEREDAKPRRFDPPPPIAGAGRALRSPPPGRKGAKTSQSGRPPGWRVPLRGPAALSAEVAEVAHARGEAAAEVV